MRLSDIEKLLNDRDSLIVKRSPKLTKVTDGLYHMIDEDGNIKKILNLNEHDEKDENEVEEGEFFEVMDEHGDIIEICFKKQPDGSMGMIDRDGKLIRLVFPVFKDDESEESQDYQDTDEFIKILDESERIVKVRKESRKYGTILVTDDGETKKVFQEGEKSEGLHILNKKKIVKVTHQLNAKKDSEFVDKKGNVVKVIREYTQRERTPRKSKLQDDGIIKLLDHEGNILKFIQPEVKVDEKTEWEEQMRQLIRQEYEEKKEKELESIKVVQVDDGKIIFVNKDEEVIKTINLNFSDYKFDVDNKDGDVGDVFVYLKKDDKIEVYNRRGTLRQTIQSMKKSFTKPRASEAENKYDIHIEDSEMAITKVQHQLVDDGLLQLLDANGRLIKTVKPKQISEGKHSSFFFSVVVFFYFISIVFFVYFCI